MKKPRISAIVALSSSDRSIGKNNELLWRISGDLKRFKQLTMGHPIIMGRKTYESIGRPLPGRTNIIVTRNKDYSAPGCMVVTTTDEALAQARQVDDEEIFIIGGGEIWNLTMPQIDRLYITLVHSPITGDIFFPDYSDFTKEISREKRSEGDIEYEWVTLER